MIIENKRMEDMISFLMPSFLQLFKHDIHFKRRLLIDTEARLIWIVAKMFEELL